MRTGFLALGLSLVMAIGGTSMVGAQDDGPPSMEIAPGVTAEGLAFAEGRSDPTLYRLRFEPEVVYDFTPDPSIALAAGESGQVTVIVDREVRVDTIEDGVSTATVVPAGQEATLAAGSYLVLPPMASGQVRNDGPAPASMLVAAIASTSLVQDPDSTASPAPSFGLVGATDAKSGARCDLEYMRADSAWAKAGSPDGILGSETITLLPGTSKTFLTDWRYEKTRNDGTTYYGSHLRRTVNRGNRSVRVRVQELGITHWVTLEAGTWDEWRADLMAVACP